MNTEIAGLVFDFGMLVLIWIVQLVIYPGLTFYQRPDLMRWHKQYVNRIAYIVMPLMIGQLSLAIVKVITHFDIIHLFLLILIIVVWMQTFFQFVPMHNRISFGEVDEYSVARIIQKNWWRTILLTIVFFVHLSKIVF